MGRPYAGGCPKGSKCERLLVINKTNNLGLILHRFYDTAIIGWNLALKIAAKPLQIETWLLLTAYKKSPASYLMTSLPTPYDLLFSHNSA